MSNAEDIANRDVKLDDYHKARFAHEADHSRETARALQKARVALRIFDRQNGFA